MVQSPMIYNIFNVQKSILGNEEQQKENVCLNRVINLLFKFQKQWYALKTISE